MIPTTCLLDESLCSVSHRSSKQVADQVALYFATVPRLSHVRVEKLVYGWTQFSAASAQNYCRNPLRFPGIAA